VSGGDHVLSPQAFAADVTRPGKPAAVLAPIVAREEGATVLLTRRTARLRYTELWKRTQGKPWMAELDEAERAELVDECLHRRAAGGATGESTTEIVAESAE
jgi:hypothetical protein